MPRNFPDWLPAYVKYAAVTEAPAQMHFWSGVSAIAGALRRKVWIDMKRFKWFPNFYIIFVAPPGIVSKTTTMNTAMGLLKDIEGIKFGPKVVTWQALIETLANSCEAFEYNDEFHPMSALTLASGELGNLIDPQDGKMIDAYITLWDGEDKFDKVTKTSGSDMVEAPWINMIGCTTPSWIAMNVPQNAIGGGFTSRCVWIHAEAKEKYVAWVDESVDVDDPTTRMRLLQDLEHIAVKLTGPFTIHQDARDWYRPLYQQHWEDAAKLTNEAMAEGYAARKQTHMCKLAMVLSASRSDSLEIGLDDLQLAHHMLGQLEPDMAKVFAKIGRTEDTVQVDRLLTVIKKHSSVPYAQAYQILRAHFPNARDLEQVLATCIRGGYIKLDHTSGTPMLVYLGGFDG